MSESNPLAVMSEAAKQQLSEQQTKEIVNQLKELNKKFDLIIKYFGITSTSRYIK